MAAEPNILLAVKAMIESLGTGASVHVSRIPQGLGATQEAVRIWTVSGSAWSDTSLDAHIGTDQDLVQFDCYGLDAVRSHSLAWNVRNGAGKAAGNVWDGVHIKGSHLSSGIRSNTDRVLIGTDQYRFLATFDVRFTYLSSAKVMP